MQTKNILLFSSADKKAKVSVFFQDGTFWLTQKAMAELFGVNVPAISKHLKNIFETGELEAISVVSKMETTASDGKNYETTFYRLEAILAVGYRVNSAQATDFRKWATQTLNEFIIKGFVMDDERLKQGKSFGQDYFAAVQNKLHWAITGQTAAEIIYTEADATKLYMGLKTWKAAPDGKILKTDVAVAKNYLSHQHVTELNRIVSAYLDLAENNAQRGIAFNMQQWVKFIDGFLELSNYPILKDIGRVSMLEAKLKAEEEYDKFRVLQDKTYESDFDREIKKAIERGG